MSNTISHLLAHKYEVEQSIRHETNRLLGEATIMSERAFWKYVGILANNIQKYKSKIGCDSFFCGQRLSKEEALSFVHTYNRKVSFASRDNIYNYLAGKEGHFRSDDGWFDFCDRLPLEGAKTYTDILEGTLPENHPVRNNHQEMYVCSALQEAIVPWLKEEEDDEEKVSELQRVQEQLFDAQAEIRNLHMKLEKLKEVLDN